MLEEIIVGAVSAENEKFLSRMEDFLARAVKRIEGAYAKRFVPNLVTLRDACDVLECTKSELAGKMNAARVIPEKKGGRWYITREELLSMMPKMEF